MINAAKGIDDLKSPPSNNLEKLKGDRKGWYSIRINKKYRIVFQWPSGNAYQVSTVDYH